MQLVRLKNNVGVELVTLIMLCVTYILQGLEKYNTCCIARVISKDNRTNIYYLLIQHIVCTIL